ncbi:unnamed protein product [Cuscuta campestris]|uniref:PH domain-containing protein n=1 Tax=Cuscuta campestris TaxID=132261 RepID=A0A484LEX8_9ASTE|nr:unnamed protein product [Cuscuta campestris]
MFEGLVRQLLLGYLGRYIRDIQKEQLKITLWNEEVLLENVELILEAFDYLQLPFALKEGHVGKLSIRIPWKKLGWDPIIIILEDVLICASQRDEQEWSMDAVRRREFAGKRAKLATAELGKLSRRVCDSQAGKSFISYITAKILENIQVSIRNMHILYRDMQTASGVTGFGLKFSSLTIMKQHLFGSGGKVRGSHVNKIVEVQGLELYCYTYQGSDKSRSVGNSVDSKTWESAISQASEKVNLLAPLDVSLCLSVNRSAGFDSSTPQYLVNIQLKSMLIYVDEVQIQQVMSFCDYLLTSQLREKYGRYRPWWSPLDKKLKGWQIAWWHYALNSVLFDIHKRLRKTSWKYLGARLNIRRKYVNLYKTKLKCLQQEQVIPEDVIHMLEEIEKESEIDEILSYRSAAERELQDILLAHTSNNVNTSKSLEDERTFNKPRGWLNWLSRGMLGAGGTDDSSQFSGIISDDVLKDIYEATKFHPVQTVDADAAATDKMFLSSIKFSINQLSVTLQRMKLGCAIAHLTLNEMSVESEIWEEETSFNATICSCEMLNPINNELVLFTRVDHDGGTISFPQPLINIHADMHSPHKAVNLSVIVQPLELTYNSDFVNNILALFHVVEEFETLNYRILLSMNGIDNIKSRLLSKVDYILSNRKKMVWDVNFATIVIKIPWGKANFEAHKLVLDVGELSIVSKNNKGFVMATSDLLDDFIEGYQLQDLYDHFEVTISNFQMNLWASCSYVPLPIIERFDGSLALKLCIIPDESVLKRLEVGMEVSSIVAHISPSLHGLLTELITDFVLPQFTQLSSDSYMLRKRPSGFAPLNIFWISANADVKSVSLFIDLEIDAGNPCSLTLSFQEIDIRVDKSKTTECWISIKTLDVKCHSSQIDEKDNVLCSSKTFLGDSACLYSNGEICNTNYNSFVMEQSFRLHYKACNSSEMISREYELCLSGLDVHCYPFIIGNLTVFFDKISEAYTRVENTARANNEISLSSSYFPCEEFIASSFCSTYSKWDPLKQSPFIIMKKPCSIYNPGSPLIFSSTEQRKLPDLSDHNIWSSVFNSSKRSNEQSIFASNPSYQCIDDTSMHTINLDLHDIKIHFHDSCSIVGSVSLPNARSAFSITEQFLDVVCSTEGLILSSLWWPQQTCDFLWGPLTPTVSPILKFCMRKETAKSRESLLELSFGIQNVSCVLPPEFLAVIIGYFSLPDWSPTPRKPPIVENSNHIDLVANTSSITYNFEILESILFVPVGLDGYQHLKLDIPQLCGSFIGNVDIEFALKNIPSECLVNADDLAHRNHCLNLFGHDLSLSLLVIKDMPPCSVSSHIVMKRHITLISPLTAKLWIRIPSQCEPPAAVASCPISITAMVNDCQLAGVSVLVAYEALVDIINQFSLTEKRSKAYNSNTSQFLEFERRLREDNASPPASSSENLMIVSACVKSMSLRLHHTKGDSVTSDIIAEANLQFTCSALFRNDELLCLKISFSALSLFSFLNSVMLFECTPHSSFPALKLTYSISKENECSLLLYIPSVDVWLHTFDWSELVDLVHSCVGEHPASHTLSISPENLTFVPIDEVGTKGIDTSRNCHRIPSSPTCLDSKSVNPSARLFRIELEIAGATVHIPVWLRNDAFNVFEGNHDDPLNDLQIMIYGNQHGFIAVTLQRGTATLVQHGKSMRLEISLDQIKGSVELHGEDELHNFPVFQLFQVNLDADISSCLVDDIRGRLDFQCDNLDVWLSDHMFYFWCLGKFQNQAAGTSQFIISCMDSKVHLRKASLIVTNGKLSSAGPLLEFLIRNLLLHSRLNEKDIEASVEGDIQANYNNIDKVFWEPFIELWSFNLFLSRIHDKTSLITEAATEIRVESTSQLNLNITESFIEVISRTVEVIKDAWDTIEMSTSSESLSLNDYRLSANLHGRRHAPYVLQNLTSLPIFFDVHTGENVSNTLGLSLTKSGKVLQPGFSVPIDVEDTPDKLVHYNYIQCPDRLRERQSSSAAHHFISFQLEGTSMPSGPFSMDLVGMRCFEVDFSKTSSETGSITNGDALKICSTVEGEASTESKDGFIVPVVIDVSIRPYTKIVRLYSTVLLSNATSVPLEVRLDIPFSVSPKILDPIYPGQQCPLPLHLAEAGLMRWRPVGSAYLWSEAYNIQNILSHENRLSILRSFVCYPSHPSSDPFRCCISVCDWSLPSVGPLKMDVLHSKCDVLGTSETFNELSHNTLRSKKRYIHRMTLSSPLVLKNYLPESVSITIENGGVTSSALLSEVENSFFHIDSSHDLTITFHLCGFNPSSIKFPRAETFVETAKCTGTIFSTWDTVTFDSISSCGPLCVTVEKLMDAFSGARELCISVPFLLYNCTWLPLVVSNAVNETKGHYCIVPSCYALDEKDLVPSKKDGLGLLSPDLDSDIAPLDNRLPISVDSHPITNSNENRSEKHSWPFLSSTVVHQYSHTHSMYSQKSSTLKSWSGPSSQSSLRSSDLLENESDKVNCCMFSPDSSFSSDETVVKVCRFLSPCITNHAPYSHWSNAFSLVPPTGSTSVIVPQPSKTSGYIMSVSATAAPFSGRTKIISFQPRYVISNACNKDVCYRQKGTNDIFFLEAGKHSHIQWIDTTRELLLSVRFVEPGWQWSGCFLPEHLGDTQVKMRNFVSGAVNMIRVEVQSADFSIRDEKIVGSPQGNSGTNLVLLSDDDTGFMPYRIDNFTKERIRIYQQKCDAFETMIHSYSSCPYAWDEPCYPHRLTIEVPGERIIGSYTLDDVKDYGHVCLSATYEKPERTLCISVCSEGATKVLRIIDSSCHDLNDSRGLHFTQLKDKGKHDRKPESATHFNDRIVVDIPFVGISLINSLPEELLFACARNITIVFKQSLDQQKVSLQIMSLQIDNQLPTTPYPVILSLDHRTGVTSSRAMRETTPESQEPAFSMEVATWRNKYLSLVSFEYIGLRVAEVHLEIDQEVVLRLLDFIKSVSSRMKGRVLPHMSPSLPLILSDLESDLSMYSYSLDFETLKSSSKQQFTLHSSLYHEISKSSVLPSITPIGAPWQKIHLLARKQKKLYVELLDMSSIKLTLSFSSSPWMLQNGVLTSGESLIHRGLMALADVEGAQIHLKHLVLSHQLASWESIQEILSDHYSRQFLHEMYKVLGSAGVIGNPMGFARNVTLGIKDFLSAPLQSAFQSRAGLITGMAQGTSSLFSNTVYAISDTATQFSKAAKKGIVAFTFDDHSIANMDRPQKRVSSNSKGVINELLEGLTGLLQSPIKGAEKHGLPGIVSGIALGVTGLVAKPTASVLDVTGKTAQSIKNWSKRLHSGNQQHFRVRLPRHLSREYPLRSYSWEEAIGASVLREADDCSSNLKDEALIICNSLKEEGKFAIITKKLLLVVSSKIFANLGKPELQGVPANLEWVIETEIGMDSIIHFDLDEQSVVHIVGSRPEILVRQNPQRRGPRRNNDPHDPLPLFQTDLAFASKEKAQNFLGTLSSSIHRTKEQQRRGHGHVLHQSSIRHRF